MAQGRTKKLDFVTIFVKLTLVRCRKQPVWISSRKVAGLNDIFERRKMIILITAWTFFVLWKFLFYFWTLGRGIGFTVPDPDTVRRGDKWVSRQKFRQWPLDTVFQFLRQRGCIELLTCFIDFYWDFILMLSPSAAWGTKRFLLKCSPFLTGEIPIKLFPLS